MARPDTTAPMDPEVSHRHPLVAAWVAQLIGTIVLAAAVMAFVRGVMGPLSSGDTQWKRYAFSGIFVAAAPALFYLRTFKERLDEDERRVKQLGRPDPATRQALMKALAVGGAFCELPQAMGVVYLFMGGETRWFLGATLVTIAIRLSYRPFTRA
jgi:hypothetical protein